MSKITINGKELEFKLNLLDADAAEQMEGLIEHVARRCEELEADNTIKMSQAIRAICQEIFSCFNTLFGEGTDRLIFGDRVNLEQCITAFAELSRQAPKQSMERMTNLMAKYAPNRATRRAAAK